MASSRRAFARTLLPQKYSHLPDRTLRDDERLLNDVADLVEYHCLLQTSISIQSAHRFLLALSKAVFYIDLYHRSRFAERGARLLVDLQKFTGYYHPTAPNTQRLP